MASVRSHQRTERIESTTITGYRISNISESQNFADSEKFIQSARQFKEATLAIKILEGRSLEDDLSERLLIRMQLENYSEEVRFFKRRKKTDSPFQLSLVETVSDENDLTNEPALETEIWDLSDEDDIEEIHFDRPKIKSNGLNEFVQVTFLAFWRPIMFSM